MNTLLVTNIQRFSTHDGDGIRTTVFLKGCPLRCKWCHNPETQSFGQQILYTAQTCIGCGACAAVCPNQAHRFSPEHVHQFHVEQCAACGRCLIACPAGAVEAAAKPMSADEIMDQVRRDKVFYGASGGITLSGGEPLAHAEECLELLKRTKAENMTTAVETSGFFDGAYIPQLAEYTDLFLWDCKDSDARRHKAYTGVCPDKILGNLHQLDRYDVKIILRCILVNGVNTEETHYRALAGLYHQLSHCAGVELLPYHAYGGSKRVQMGYADDGVKAWIPQPDVLQQATAVLKSLNVPVLS
ncbi:MAG: glycyl-radical enzyme activating protein [Clostridiaceae bacterium]|nr:glycyl-radical enzyme activating protein [Clostridiaceae bacterium]